MLDEIPWLKSIALYSAYSKHSTIVDVVQSWSHAQLLRPHELHYTRPPCPSLSLRICSNSCSLSQWGHPIISSSVARFAFPQSFLASGFFPESQLFTSGGQNNSHIIPKGMNINDTWHSCCTYRSIDLLMTDYCKNCLFLFPKFLIYTSYFMYC